MKPNEAKNGIALEGVPDAMAAKSALRFNYFGFLANTIEVRPGQQDLDPLTSDLLEQSLIRVSDSANETYPGEKDEVNKLLEEIDQIHLAVENSVIE